MQPFLPTKGEFYSSNLADWLSCTFTYSRVPVNHHPYSCTSDIPGTFRVEPPYPPPSHPGALFCPPHPNASCSPSVPSYPCPTMVCLLLWHHVAPPWAPSLISAPPWAHHTAALCIMVVLCSQMGVEDGIRLPSSHTLAPPLITVFSYPTPPHLGALRGTS